VKRKLKKTSVALHTISGRSFEGVLISERGQYYELRNASVEVDGKLVPADGAVLVPKKIVEFIQVTK
jgi:hypothetical protein